MGVSENRRELRDDVLAGSGLGTFLGLVIGLSSSPVAGMIIAALGGVLASVVGLRTRDGPAGLRPVRVAALGLVGAGSMLIGLWLRTHDALSPSIDDEVQEWLAVGLPRHDALALTVGRRTGRTYEILVPTASERVAALVEAGFSKRAALRQLSAQPMSPATAPATQDGHDTSLRSPDTSGSVLFSDPVGDYFCAELEQKRYEYKEELRIWKARDGAWERAAGMIEELPTDKQSDALARVRALVCR
jgi:hypothetical protein